MPPAAATSSPRFRSRPPRRAPTASSWRSTPSPSRRSATARRRSTPTASPTTSSRSSGRPRSRARRSPPSEADRLIVAVLGVGLVGGSVGLAARERLGAEVRGYDPAPGVLDAALARGAVASGCDTAAEALDGASAAFVAAPVRALPEVVRAALAAAAPDCVVTDVGSTKRELVGAVEDRRFIGGHPLAGAETARGEHARAELFDGATWYLTPTPQTEGVLYDRLYRLLADLGPRPPAIDADT